MLTNQSMRREWIICLALFVITAALYWPVGRYGYVNCDDPEYASANPHIQQGLTPAGVVWAFRAVVASNWHPVTCLSLMLDCQLFGNNAGTHHLINLLFHLANVILLFLIWRRMTDQIWPSALVAALFAWHPLHVESVAWISERKDVLSTFFGLLALWAYVNYVRQQTVVETGQSAKTRNALTAKHRRLYLYFLTLFFFALGLMSKPMLVTWPFVLLLLDFWPLKRITSFNVKDPRLRHLLLEKLPLLALASGICALTVLTQRTAGTMELLGHLPISVRVGNALVSCVRYLGKTIWPDHLAFFYPYPGVGIIGSEPWTEWQVAGSALGLALITGVAIRQARRRPFLIVGWLWFLGTLVPVIGLVQVGGQAMADRYTYIPLIGVFVMVVWYGKELDAWRPSGKLASRATAIVSLGACLVVTNRQVRFWRNSETLCEHAIAVTAHNYKAHFNLGLAFIADGKDDAGIKQLYEALAIAPSFSGRSELANALLRQGKIREAMKQYEEALRYTPNEPILLNNLAFLLATKQDPKLRNGVEAVKLAKRACALTHYQTTVYIGTLAAAYAEAGHFDDAVKTAERAIASARASGDKELLEKNLNLLKLYRTGQPYHEAAEE